MKVFLILLAQCKLYCNFACETKVIINRQTTKSMRKVISVFVLSGILASCGINKTTSTSDLNPSKEQTTGEAKLKEAANNAFLALFRDYSEEGAKKYIHPNLIQHNPFVPTGRDALIGFLPALKQSGISYTNHRILQDGEFVVLHNSFTNAQAFGAEKIVTIDIYRMKDGQAVEHWDVIQEIPTEGLAHNNGIFGF